MVCQHQPPDALAQGRPGLRHNAPFNKPPSEPRTSYPLDPNIVHDQLADATRPALTFEPGGDVTAWQDTVRAKVRELLRVPTFNGPLEVESLWQRPHPSGLGTIEKIHFTAEPGVRVNGYVCLPGNAKPPYKWMLCLQGHSSGAHLSVGLDRETETQPIVAEGDRDFALQSLRHGWAALAIDQRGFGERRPEKDLPKNSQECHEPSLRALLLGRTINGERLLDVQRCIDYLDTRLDVAEGTLGIMGNSSGGTTTLYASALLPRITHAMPSCSICTYRASLLGVFHCLCNFIPDLYQWVDMPDVLGCFAPRPLVIVHAQHDEYFPLEGTHEAYTRIQEIYAAAGAPDKCQLVVGDNGHRFYADLAWPVFKKLASCTP